MMLESSTQSDFPYSFSEEGVLRHRHTCAPFRFSFSLDALEMEREHRAVCVFITGHVQDLLRRRFGLVRLALGDSGSVMMSPGALEQSGSLLLLIPDAGTQRSGLWSWRLAARDGLDRGSQIPYVRWALSQSIAVILMNPNEGDEAPEAHVRLVWERMISGSAAQHVLVVAHGYGGLAFVDLLCSRPEELQRRVSAVAFLDSSHSLYHQPLGRAGRDWLKSHSRTWILSSKPLNRSVGSLKAGCTQLSAGTQSHDAAPSICMEAVTRFFSRSLKPRAAPTPFEIVTRSRSRSHAGDHNNNS